MIFLKEFFTFWSLIYPFLILSGRPQFIEKYPTVVDSGIYNLWKFNIKSYTTVIEKCTLMSSSENQLNLIENYTLTGEVPNLLLTIVIFKNASVKSETLSLSLHVDEGFSETLNFPAPQSEYSLKYFSHIWTK